VVSDGTGTVPDVPHCVYETDSRMEEGMSITLLVLSIFLTIVGVLAFAVAVSLMVYYMRH